VHALFREDGLSQVEVAELLGAPVQLSDSFVRGNSLDHMQKVQAGKLDMALGAFLKTATDIRRTPFFRFALMVIHPDNDPAFRPASTTWSALKGEALISLPSSNPVQGRKSRRNAECKELSSMVTILLGWAWATFMRFRGPQALSDRFQILNARAPIGPLIYSRKLAPKLFDHKILTRESRSKQIGR
jgi:hypothetical protein